ncbi:hypothetical protein [Streptomyces sioyaensis]|uniref:hypothetical protein n=1 Tax=Streptomyces sioyaensis TaxID=67364 RepID=UPI00379AB42B
MITMMRGCGLSNGEARAVNTNNVISDDIYRVSDQIHHNTYRPAPLKHRHPGEFRDVPLPRSVRETIERFEQRPARQTRATCCADRTAISPTG